MLLGPPMPAPNSRWRFVESDLYDTAGRVREYDSDARLVRDSRSGQLGLARWDKTSRMIGGGHWRLARALYDLDTDQPLRGEPDPRVLRCQRAFDGWRLRSIHDFARRSRRAELRAEEREYAQILDEEGPHAEQYVHRLRRDMGAKQRAFVPRGM